VNLHLLPSLSVASHLGDGDLIRGRRNAGDVRSSYSRAHGGHARSLKLTLEGSRIAQLYHPDLDE
jgi:hypothetical protein